ncbi:hypothetical protein A2690_02150 [Candidatus Roizmanbacteria bacterium RIFCSPHIGHO2_01_FULL_39_12b]|uniref:Cupin type-2 domain-containing protein n=1 Tax=Candidatus Roizmanbacteria bacterium RIFCSPHIGHO2_01_FULL_39_12b TaxID=1802030 RepID=A0A1F7GDY3_9BACT|nr:MAG: hypothetical protein A2690_02150 [Candidatus Roizmanbacteria bacterium RIFCSPHIGHO2_01_FULL_39_12b]OGK46328.1 MAG: hypothetical protein A3B46_00120 [Candidatus Roizmanbacteria bacterium RIFCSPLOWO2_01_FULL_39_19]
MKLIKKENTNIIKNSDVCTAFEYPLDDKDINAAIIHLSGRYPDKGRTVNLECKELVYVLKGSGKLTCEDNEVLLSQGDLVLIDKGENYYWEGNMDLFVPCTPAWNPKQHKIIE